MSLPPAALVTLSRLLDQALDLAPSEVEAWLAGLPDEHGPLRGPLREMLAAHLARDHSRFLVAGPAFEHGDDTVATAGDAIGPYRLVREIGSGGMGAVWLAERVDGGLKRSVALKLPRLAWGAGLAQRMARERDIGALLEHPHIARLYDAGLDARGRPYLALEFIDGQPLDAWCDRQRLGVSERLRLFVQVARAVAYAHGRLVVHRDIKPSNVLVTPDGQAHLLDFGIAKLLGDADAGASSSLTQEQGRPMTPRYASPEQITGDTVTVASDVYSLGVLLYELMTGASPYTATPATATAIEKAIDEGAVLPASARASDKGIARRLRGELDAILAKALRREASQRYATVDAFAADVERHLSGELVQARPDSLAYRARKTFQRHRIAFSAAGLVLVAVLGGTGAALAQAGRANREAERARLVKEFVIDIFDSKAGPDGALARMPAEALLERSAGNIDRKFAGQPLLQAELYGVVSRMFMSIAKNTQAVAYATRRVEALGSANADRAEAARATLDLGNTLNDVGRFDDAMVRHRRAIELAEGDDGLRARALAGLAFAEMYSSNDTDGAARELDAAEALVARGKVSDLDRATVLFTRADWLGDSRSRAADAKPIFDQAIRLALAAEGSSSRLAMQARLEAAKIMVRRGNVADGRDYLATSLAAMRADGGRDDVNAALWESHVTGWMFNREAISFAEAMQVFARSRASLRSQTWPLPASTVAQISLREGTTLVRWGDVTRGYPLVAEGMADSGPAPLDQWWLRNNLLWAASDSDHVGDAIHLGREMIDIGKRWQTGPDISRSYYPLVLALIRAERYADAEATLAELDAIPGMAAENATDRRNGVSPNDARLLIALERGRFRDVIDMTTA